MKRCLIPLLLLTAAGCGRRNVSVPLASTVPPAEASFIELQPGWRLRAIVPLWKPGAAMDRELTVQDADEKARSLTLQPNQNFLGYETQYYLLRKHWGVLQIRFDSADMTKDGITSPVASPSPDLFEIPSGTKHVRLVFLERASQADHNMAVLAASHDSILNDATKSIQSDPVSCSHLRIGYCSWIPPGVAVRAEMPIRTATGINWQPAR